MRSITIGATGFDGTDIGGGVSEGEVVTIAEDNSKTLYVSSPSDLPAAVGGEITIDLTTTGGKNVVKFTQSFSLGSDVIILGQGVSLDANRQLSLDRVVLSTNAPGKALVSGVGKSFSLTNLTLTNTGAGGSCFDLEGTGQFDIDSAVAITDCILKDTENVGKITNTFGLSYQRVGKQNIQNGLQLGSATKPPPTVMEINNSFNFDPTTTTMLTIDASLAVGATLNVANSFYTNIPATFYGIDIIDAQNLSLIVIDRTTFSGVGQPINGFDSEDPGVIISENCTGVISTPTNYWAKYKDSATQTTPIVLPNAVPTKLTCDGVAGIERHFPSTITDLWDTTANKIKLTDIPIGRPLTIIINMSININQNASTISLFGQGLGVATTIFNADTITVDRKNAEVVIEKRVFVDVETADLQANGIEIFLRIDDPATATGTVKVNYIIGKRG